ncbi:MAG: hypothetical protein CVU46_08350 [Chloroflexi bacterium HGW-Chloroflexi-8]|nr:MAG: hypothetical protein CVU46_08350 [Chloroflexi bacterium HGW-Chloroflexi-8]
MPNITICPLCKKENTENLSICSNCGFDLNPTFSPENEKIPDWLSSFREESENEQTIPAQNAPDISSTLPSIESAPEWLSRIRERKNVDEEFGNVNDQINPKEPQRQLKGTDELVGGLRNNEEGIFQEDIQNNEIVSDLRKFQEDSLFEIPTNIDSHSEKLDQSNDGLQEINEDWISRLTKNQDSENDNRINENPEKLNERRLPDWLPSVNQIEPDSNSVSNSNSQEFPDWMAKFRKDQIESVETPGGSDETLIPDWIDKNALPDFDNQQDESEISDINEIRDLNEILEQKIPNKTDLEIPDWISETKPEKSELSETEKIISESNLISSDNPSLIEGDGKKNNFNEPFFIEDSRVLEIDSRKIIDEPVEENENLQDSAPMGVFTPPFQIDQIPDWLENNEEFIPTNLFEDTEFDIEKNIEIGKDLERGELPSWLKAMRPIEAVAPIISRSKENKQVENSGPLAGLKGVLSPHIPSNFSTPPPIQSTTLEVSEKQKKQIEILNNLFSLEIEAPSISKPKANIYEKLIQIIIPITLLGLIIYSMYFSSTNIVKPSIYPAETVRFASIVNGLILNQSNPPRILTIMESDGASLGEIKILTKDVLERLMVKDSFLSIISTNPNGSLLASGLIRNISDDYNYADFVTNFGYLPGGQSGIHSFIQSPKETILYGAENEIIWDKPGLIDVNSFSKFDAVFIITDDSDATKTWVEQIHLLSPEMTILVAATAQAIPLLRPYVDSNQIDGMIGGLYGTYSYSDLLQSDNKNIEYYWKPQKTGVLFFVFIIILGGTLQLVVSLSKRIDMTKLGSK